MAVGILEHEQSINAEWCNCSQHIIVDEYQDINYGQQRLIELLPEGPRYYPEDEITDIYERDIAADMIRAACLQVLRDEVPYCIAVRIDEYKERNEHGAYVQATLMVERKSQKGIVIGKQGRMLKEIGTLARKEIEAMSGRKVYLDLKVSVLPRWRNDENALKRFGYYRPKR